MRRFKQFVFNSLSSHLATGTTSRTANPTAAAAVPPRQTTAAAATATATTPTPPPKTAETFPPLRRKTTRTRPRRRPQTITIKGDQASAGFKCRSSNISLISLFFCTPFLNTGEEEDEDDLDRDGDGGGGGGGGGVRLKVSKKGVFTFFSL